MNGFENFQQNQQGPMQQPSMGPQNWNVPTMNPAMMGWMANWMNALYGQNGNMNNGWSNNQNQGNFQNGNNQSNSMNDNSNQQSARPSVSCGIISSPDEIKPADIPMDGNIGMFAMKDLSKIYLKQWNSEGKINTREFVELVPEPVQAAQPTPNISLQDVLDNVNARFERIEGLLSILSQQVNPNVPKKQNTNNSQKPNQRMEGTTNGQQ